MEKKFDFDAYLKWCKENHLEASESSVLEHYKRELEKVAQTSEEERKIAAQKKVFDTIAKYVGKNVEYSSKHFKGLNEALGNIVLAMEMCNFMEDTAKSLEEVFEKHKNNI